MKKLEPEKNQRIKPQRMSKRGIACMAFSADLRRRCSLCAATDSGLIVGSWSPSELSLAIFDLEEIELPSRGSSEETREALDDLCIFSVVSSSQ